MSEASNDNMPIEQVSKGIPSIINEGPTDYEKMITDILKFLTTLNTGLLAILAAFNQAILPVFKSNNTYTTYFIMTFFLSLGLCMLGFVMTVFIIRNGKQKNSVSVMARDLMVVTASASYIAALMFFLTLFKITIQA